MLAAALRTRRRINLLGRLLPTWNRYEAVNEAEKGPKADNTHLAPLRGVYPSQILASGARQRMRSRRTVDFALDREGLVGGGVVAAFLVALALAGRRGGILQTKCEGTKESGARGWQTHISSLISSSSVGAGSIRAG